MYRALVQSKDRSKTNVMLEDCEDELDSDDDSDCDEDVVEVEVEQVVREVLPPRPAHTPRVAANVLQVFTILLLLLGNSEQEGTSAKTSFLFKNWYF